MTWEDMTPEQQQGLIDAYEEGKVIEGIDVMDVIRELQKRYGQNTLTLEQHHGLIDALEDVKKNGGKSHEDVICEMLKRYE